MRVTLGWFRINSINPNVFVSNNLIVRTLDMRPRSLPATSPLELQYSSLAGSRYGKVP